MRAALIAVASGTSTHELDITQALDVTTARNAFVHVGRIERPQLITNR
jgi:hypothetical protein